MSWIARILGAALTIGSLIFVGSRILEFSGPLAANFSNPRFLATLMVRMALYALLGALIGYAWTILVRACDQDAQLSIRQGLVIFCRSQIFKYLPSNVLHLVGRHGMARQASVSHTALVFGVAAETGLLAIAASVIATTLTLPLVLEHGADALNNSSTALVVVAVLGIVLVGSLWWLRREGLLRPRLGMTSLAALGLYFCFFLANGALLWAVATSLGHSPSTSTWFVFGVVTAAWLGGFIVPGAPAGVGVREAILISGLGMAGWGPIALSAALGYRIITLGGDVIVAMIGFAFRR